jgi:hypothetical protein
MILLHSESSPRWTIRRWCRVCLDEDSAPWRVPLSHLNSRTPRSQRTAGSYEELEQADLPSPRASWCTRCVPSRRSLASLQHHRPYWSQRPDLLARRSRRSRGCHGRALQAGGRRFESARLHLTFRCANQRRNLARGEDLIPAHHAKLLHEQSEQGLALLRGAGTKERPEVYRPLRDIDGARILWNAFRVFGV